MSSMTPKVLMFNIEIGEPKQVQQAQAGQQQDAEGQKLEEMVRQLSSQLTSVKHEQDYMAVREKVHRTSKLLLLFFWS